MHTAEQVYGDSGAPVTSTDTAGIKGGSMEVLAIVIEWMLQKRKGKRNMTSKESITKYTNYTNIQNIQILGLLWLRFHLPMQGVWVRCLVRELRSHMPHIKKTKYKTEAILQQIKCSTSKKKTLKKHTTIFKP